MPKYCKNEYVKYKWDIKCDKTDKSFMIYNWVNEDKSFGVFESTEWYLIEISSVSEIQPSSIQTKFVLHNNFMDFFESQKEVEAESFDIEVFNPVKNEIKQQDKKYLEGPSYENLEINLDDIEF